MIKKNARSYFSVAISDINNIINYSSININQNYYTYLEDIYNVCTKYEQKKKRILLPVKYILHFIITHHTKLLQYANGHNIN